MKTMFLFTCTLIFLFCNTRKTTNPDWLAGNWKRTNDKPGQESFEQWIKISDREYAGIGFTLQKADTVFKEKLRISYSNGTWNYEVTGVHKQPVLFVFNSLNENGFICENRENNFPKTIEYHLKGDELTAVIADGDKTIPFYFIKHHD